MHLALHPSRNAPPAWPVLTFCGMGHGRARTAAWERSSRPSRPASASDLGSEELLRTVFISLGARAELGVSGVEGVGDAFVGGVGRQSMRRT